MAVLHREVWMDLTASSAVMSGQPFNGLLLRRHPNANAVNGIEEHTIISIHPHQEVRPARSHPGNTRNTPVIYRPEDRYS
jgi:hypothetical protein